MDGATRIPYTVVFEATKKTSVKYAYASISGGGAINNNSGLPGALKRRTGVEAVTVVDMHIADLLPPGPKPTTQSTSTYRLTAQDIENLTKRAVGMLREKLLKEVWL